MESHTEKFDWSSMEAFLAIARTGRLTVAAQRLGIDHTTLSRRIKQLETALQTRLFERSVNGYQLTSQGERFLKASQQVETIALQAAQDISGSSSKIAGSVRIGATDGFGTIFLAPRLVAMSAEHPELSVELVTMPRLFNLTKREADLAIGLTRPDKGRLYAHKLTDYELGLYGSVEYLERTGQPANQSELRRHRLVGYVPELIYADALNYIPHVTRDVEPWITSSNLVAQLNMTLAHAGLCILPRFMASVDPRLKQVLADEVRLVRSFWLIVHADIRDLARIRYCSEFLTEEVRANRKLFLS
ncbi:LysR family transcriptional regulator [Agrobacterium deltaense]|uniref:LysR family transcriptional regulator n=1 Tax=Agrobacterium deltaense TaxID=1183412 RepID=UPI003FD4D7F4